MQQLVEEEKREDNIEPKIIEPHGVIVKATIE